PSDLGSQACSQRASRACQGQNTATPVTLNRVWNSASCSSALSPNPSSPLAATTSQVSGASSVSASPALTRLNSTCASASRWPLRLPPSAPTTPVLTLLPTLDPIASARAWPSSSWPAACAARISIKVAWLDCSTTVAPTPASTSSSTPDAPPDGSTDGSKPPPTASNPAFTWSMPRNTNAIPSTTRPAARPFGPATPPS